MKQRIIAVIGLVALLAAAAAANELPTLRFDMGGADGPLARGFQAVSADAAYSADRGFGWESQGQQAFLVPDPGPEYIWTGPGSQVTPKGYIVWKEYTPLTADGVQSQNDLSFRADVPNGVYRVKLTLGNLDQALGSLQVYVNDELTAKDFDVKHFARRGAADHLYGYARTIRRIVEVTDGSIRVRLHGDETTFLEKLKSEGMKPRPGSYLTGGGPKGNPPKTVVNDPSLWGAVGKSKTKFGGQLRIMEDIGAPFRGNAINAIEIYPFVKPPLWLENDTLTATVNDRAAISAVKAFNAGDFKKAEELFDQVSDSYTRALGYLWLAGRPQYEEEERLVPKTLAIFDELSPARKDDLLFDEFHEMARRLDTAIHRFIHRSEEGRAYNQCLMISGEIASVQPEDPTYYKGLIYAGRGFYMVIPHRWAMAAGCGRQCFDILERDGFGDNRFVQWFLYDKWHGMHPDWTLHDYRPEAEGAPEWARYIYEAYNREVDLAEWWFVNRQREDGSLGGGWGDDVEILRGLGAFGAISPDASDIIIDGVRKLANGAWNSGWIDTVSGYFHGVADSEHTGEWTGDTIPPMIAIDYGNPIYIERGLKTAKLMRDLWMAENEKGHFLMRSNLLGAVGIGNPSSHNDSRINGRPASPARKVLWYNNLPTLQELFIKWADAWVAASMSNDRGKPAGIIPQEIAWADSMIGGVDSPSWYENAHPAGTVNYDYRGAGGYHGYIEDIMMLAYKATGDEKYLTPMAMQAEFAKTHMPEKKIDPNELEPGSNEWVAAQVGTWPKQWESIKRVMLSGPEDAPQDFRTLDGAMKMGKWEAEGAWQRWPHVTTEGMATDRVYYPGLGAATRVMTARGVQGAEMLVTYRGLGRKFAAAVLQVSSSSLRVVIYNMAQEQKAAAVVPWLLDVGGTYEVKIGPDDDNDGKMDSVAVSDTVKVETRGQDFPFTIQPRRQLVMEIRMVKQGFAGALYPDPGISAEDITYEPKFKTVIVTVHNIGAKRAKNIRVRLYEGDNEIGTSLIPNIEAPLDFNPQIVRVGFAFEISKPVHKLTAKLELESGEPEITKTNNKATAEITAEDADRFKQSSP